MLSAAAELATRSLELIARSLIVSRGRNLQAPSDLQLLCRPAFIRQRARIQVGNGARRASLAANDSDNNCQLGVERNYCRYLSTCFFFVFVGLPSRLAAAAAQLGAHAVIRAALEWPAGSVCLASSRKQRRRRRRLLIGNNLAELGFQLNEQAGCNWPRPR